MVRTVGNQDARQQSPSSRRLPFVVQTAVAVLLFAVAFCVLQRLTFTLRLPSLQRPTIWTPGALTFTALLLAPPRRWWVYYAGLCLGVFAAFHGDAAIPVATAMLATPFHFGAVALGAWGIRRLGTNPPFGSLASLLVLIAVAVVLVPVFTTGPVDLVRFASGADDLWPVALRGGLSGSLGILIATPAFTLTVANGFAWLRAGSRRDGLELVALAGGLVTAGYFCFAGPTGTAASPALLYAPLPLLLWAAIRFELAGVCWALLALAFQSTWAAAQGRGPFTNQAPADNVLQLQLFLLATSVPLMFLAIVVRERRRAYLALSESEQEARRQYAQLATIYHNAPVGLAFVDTQLRYVSINDYLAEINGLTAAAHLGRTVRQVLPVLADKIEPAYRRVIETGEPIVDTEVHWTTASEPGIEQVCLVSRYPVKDPQGNVLGVNTVVQDITERIRAEEVQQALFHASRLAIVGELTASIAHEINQPLGAILSNADAAEMLLASTPASLDEVRQILDDIRKDDLRASEVIRRLRTLLRKRELEMQPLDLNELTSEVLTLVRSEALRRGVTVDTDLAVHLPAVRGDKVHLQQVLLNLVLNGMEAMADISEAKRLTVRTVLRANGCVEISVTDAGTGIPPDTLRRLFDPFFSTKREGMGVGLSIARSLVEAHRGRIWAENNVSGGATFRFTVPTGTQKPGKESAGAEKATLEWTT
jgi:two-component system, LuxR family, sensor kinase FixL